MATKDCRICGQPFVFPRGRNLTCEECRTHACAMCGRTFLDTPPAVYCSLACARAARPPTYRECDRCGKRFGPIGHLARRFCSYACKVAAQRTGRRWRWIPTPEARRAQRHVRYYVESGKIAKPDACEWCGRRGRVEAAHQDYSKPLDIRWLCGSCHRRWDRAEPKGGAMRTTA